jgi:hypothetical protein
MPIHLARREVAYARPGHRAVTILLQHRPRHLECRGDLVQQRQQGRPRRRTFDGFTQAAAVQAFNLNAWQSKRLLMMQERP